MIRFERFLTLIKRQFYIYLGGLFLLLSIRLFFLFRLFSIADIRLNIADILHAILVGFRFDTMVLMYGMALPVLLSIFSLIIGTAKSNGMLTHFNRIYAMIMLMLFVIVGIVDVYYYNYFQSHINVLAFGLFDDDTTAVLKSVWTDYPIISVLIAWIIVFFIIRLFVNYVFSDKVKSVVIKKAWQGVACSLFVLAMFFLGMRGSIGTFPLQIDDSTVCNNSTVNLIPINGVFAIKEAFLMRSKQMSIEGNITFLKKLDYDSETKAIEDYYGQAPEKDLGKSYFTITANKPSGFKYPNVVFFLMESMSNNNLFYHSTTLNLYGALEKHLTTDYFLRNFLPSGNGTINSLEGIMVNTPVTSLAQSEHNSVSYNSSVALPFSNAGYETTFITGGKFGWRNINEFIPHQYFQHVESKDNVLKEIAGSTECEWGVYDEYLFDYVFKKLEKATKPQMIFVLTTTNHTPFHLPETYKPYPVKLTDEIKSKLLTDENLAVKNLTNLQYSNNCLGKFMDKVKQSNFSQNTIVAATGDHNNLMLFDFNESQMYYQRSVPLYLYVPETIQPHVTINKWGSHKDIFPTLINLALPQSTYFNAGDNLFDTLQSRNNIFATDWMSMEAMNEFGAVKYGESVKYFDWDKNKMLKETSAPSADLQKLLQRARAHYAAMAYFIRNETLKTKQGK